MSQTVVTGVAPRWEGGLAELLGRSGQAQLVRRCADVPELLGVALAGLARIAVVSSDFRSLDRAAVETLLDSGVAVVGLHPPDHADQGRALSRWGVRVVVPADLEAAALDEAIGTALEATLDTVLDSSLDGDADSSLDDADGSRDGGGDGRRDDPLRGEDRVRGEEALGDPELSRHLEALQDNGEDGAAPDDLVGAGTDPVDEELRRLVEEASGELPERDGPTDTGPEGGSTGGPATAGPGTAAASGRGQGVAPQAEAEPGQVVVVWGPGSPGRTTIAVNLAAELADPLAPVVLVDADTVGASVAQHLAVLDEAPGLVAAARAADLGTLDRRSLGTLAPEVRPGLRLLSGLPRAERWPEVRDSALADVIEMARRSAAFVVIDVAAGVEQDEELSFDTLAPRRNGATLTALEAADRIIVVGAGDPVGLQRLVRGLDTLSTLSGMPRDVVVTRVRPGPVGPDPQRRIREALERFAGVREVHLVPEDRESLDAALLHGRALAEVRPSSTARVSMQQLAAHVAGRSPVPRRAGRRWWARHAPDRERA